MTKITKRALELLAAVALTACGGGGDSDSGGPGPGTGAGTAEGAYGGSLTNSSADAFNMVVLENGEFWAVYGSTFGEVLVLEGLVHGTGASNNGAFTSSNARDFNLAYVADATVSGTYVAGRSITGSFNYGSTASGFSGTTEAVAPYDYNQQASLQGVTGTWPMASLGGSPAEVTLASDGAFQGYSDGCSITGTMTPRPSGKNVFNVRVNFGAWPCAAPNSTADGIAIYSPIEGSSAHQLLVAWANSAGTVAGVAVGQR